LSPFFKKPSKSSADFSGEISSVLKNEFAEPKLAHDLAKFHKSSFHYFFHPKWEQIFRLPKKCHFSQLFYF
jgi:hypothetical protein